MLKRDPNSHKGDNGKVMVIGGSSLYHGAPILCALGAQSSGVDLIFPFLPPRHIEAAKTYSLNFILHAFREEELGLSDVDLILEWSEKVDVVAIGSGLDSTPKTVKALKRLFSELKRPVVIDGGALIDSPSFPAISVLTPHRGEFKRMTGEDATPETVQKWAAFYKTTIVCKGPQDIIANKETIAINETGNAFMTVGGTGDVLAGFIAGLMAQKMTPVEAAETATNILGVCAENLIELQANLTAYELIKRIPQMMLQQL
ncbi:NAD(P)H-hydrate dehydratase [Candidatus Peregrinibacteria bacterium]|nr:NAD(P)H-hydrate dehydratase [Candidatus Peregrinibacteria bacterium]